MLYKKMIIHICRTLSIKRKVILIQLYFHKEHHLKEIPDKPIITSCKKNSHQYFDKEILKVHQGILNMTVFTNTSFRGRNPTVVEGMNSPVVNPATLI